MKKSKILIPAFAVLALSVGASVTGTVAWFTASRSATFGSTFATKDLEGSLSVKSTGLIGTTEGTSGNITVDGGLYHGSYDAQKAAAGNLYLANFGEKEVAGEDGATTTIQTVNGYSSKGTVDAGKTGAKPVDSQPISSSWYAGTVKETEGETNTTINVWYGVAWEMEIKLTNPSATSTDHLFVSFKGSKVTDANKGDTVKGLRIAFMTKDHFTVLAGDTETKHVTSAGTLAKDELETNLSKFTGSYDNTKNFGSFNEDYSEAMDAELATLQANKGYLGVIDHTNGIKVTAVAWFEGEDSNIKANKKLSDVAATIKVYSRSQL